MRLDNLNKSVLWSILEKYDNNSDYKDFCNSISNVIQNKSKDIDYIKIYQNFYNIDKEDYQMIENTIGIEINNFLFMV